MSIITCGYNCYFIPYEIELQGQTLAMGFYRKKKGQFIGPFETIDCETKENL